MERFARLVRRRGPAALAVLASLLLVSRALAQEAPPQLGWTPGPGVMPVGDVAEIQLSAEFVALGQADTRRFLELNQNPTRGNEVAIVAPVAENEGWFVVFEYDEIGYVRDDEKDELDAAAMLASIREGTEAGNAEREKRGWPSMQIVGWQEEPHYDGQTNNLTWAILGQSAEHRTVNKLVKLLGRRGVMTATLVAGPEEFAPASATTDTLLAAYHFRQGHTYAEFVDGSDSVAEIGLKGLILGGAGAALIKSGLLGKFWKAIVVAVVGLGAGLKRLFGGRQGSAGTPS